jgi:hypothetical protein
MNNAELYTAYHEALENGNTTEVLRLANIVDFVAIADADMLANPMPKPEKNFKFSVPQGFDYENAILARDERNNMDT